MENLDDNCNLQNSTKNTVDWSKEPLITLMDAAKAGILLAQKELEKRQEQFERELATLSGNTNIKINWIED